MSDREDDLDREIRDHLELETGEQTGLSREEARYAARRAFGNPTLIREATREMWRWASIERPRQDLRFAWRMLRKNPGFTAVVMLTLALGIGANTAIFSVVNAVLLKPLPCLDADRLVMIWDLEGREREIANVTPPDFVDWQARSHAFAQMAAIEPSHNFILTGAGEPQRLSAAAVSGNFFSLLGTRITPGRDFRAEEDRPGHNNVVILSRNLWEQRFGSGAAVIGRAITLNGASHTVIGVLPPDFQFPGKRSDFGSRNQFDVWTPLALNPEPWMRGTHPLRVFARLKPGVSMAQAQADLDVVARSLEAAYPESNTNRGVRIVPLAEQVVTNVRTALLTLLGAVGLVLLIACANVASLLLSRAAARRKEIAVRLALGASRARLAQQLFTEALLLSLPGGVAGLAAGWWSVQGLVLILPADLPRAGEIALDVRVFGFTALVSIATGLLFGLFPILQAQRASAHDSMTEDSRSVTGASWRLRNALAVGEIGLALTLLAGAGLMTKSLWRLMQVSPGYRTGRILTATLPFSGSRFWRDAAPFCYALLERVRSLPGVQSAGITEFLPLTGMDNSWSFEIEGRPPLAPGKFNVANYRPVSPGYFETMGVPLLKGRALSQADSRGAPLVVLISESLARAHFPDENPIGRRIRLNGNNLPRRIAGVVGDVRQKALDVAADPVIYPPLAQAPTAPLGGTLVVRTPGEPASLAAALRREVVNLDRNQPVHEIRTMKQWLSTSVGAPRFRTLLMSGFALVALVMASVGIHGLMSYMVAMRTRELGIRIALGAEPGDVLGLVLRRAVVLLLAGLGLGLLGSAVLARFVATLLFEVSASDMATFAGVSLFLSIVTLLTSWLPAHRASRTEPMVALRYE